MPFALVLKLSTVWIKLGPLVEVSINPRRAFMAESEGKVQYLSMAINVTPTEVSLAGFWLDPIFIGNFKFCSLRKWANSRTSSFFLTNIPTDKCSSFGSKFFSILSMRLFIKLIPFIHINPGSKALIIR